MLPLPFRSRLMRTRRQERRHFRCIASDGGKLAVTVSIPCNNGADYYVSDHRETPLEVPITCNAEENSWIARLRGQ